MSTDADLLAAVRYELATYLRTFLAPLIGTDADPTSPTFGASLVTVREAWPTPAKRLNEYDVTVLATGEADDWYFFPPVKVATVPTTPGQGLITFSYGRIEGLQLDIDCFGTAPTKRDDLCRHMRHALNRPINETVAGAPQPQYLTLGRGTGLVLKLSRFFDTLCDFQFSPIGAPVENSDAAKAGEWRAHFRGGATLDIRDQQAFALIQRIGLTVNTGRVSHTRMLPKTP